MGERIQSFFAAWELFQLPAISATLIGAVLGFLGIYVVTRRLVFLTAAISQMAGLGVAFAFYAHVQLGVLHSQVHHTAGALLLTILSILPFARRKQTERLHRDNLLGLLFLVGSAGTLAIGTRIVAELHDIESLLFGSAVAVLPEDFQLLVLVFPALFFFHLWWRRGFMAVSLDADGAFVRGLPVGLLNHLLFLSLAVALSISTQILGALPTFALGVLPAMTALRVSLNIEWAFLFATLLGAFCGFFGYLFAFLFELPVGATQTLLAACCFVFALFYLGIRARVRCTV